MTPRIRARVGTGEDNKFYFEISIWDLYGKQMMSEPFTLGPWKTEAIAHEEMKKAVQLVCESIEKDNGAKEPSGEYLDMKNGGQLRPWVEQ